MGTTMTVALVEGMTVAIGHVGDSRAYLVRGEQMEQLTEDHSLVNELLKTGKLSEEEAHVHPQRSVITRAVGTDPDVDVDGFTIEAEEGDVFLICSDGLSDMVEDERDPRGRPPQPRRPRQGREGARRGREQGRRRGQHHRHRLPDLLRGSAEPRGHGRDARAHGDRGRARRADARVRRSAGNAAATRWSSRPARCPRRAVAQPAADARRVRFVLIGIVVVALAAALVVWWLSR